MTEPFAYTVVVPTVGRESLRDLLLALAGAAGPPPVEVVVVDDRRDGPPLVLPDTGLRVTRRTSGGRGPAAARNTGWRLATTEWIAFLDDDVVVAEDWRQRLVADLADLPTEVGASQGRIVVPAPPDGRRPADHEQATHRLAGARWITADMAYRRSALAAVGGFDERFPRAYREDTDLALRVGQAGWRIVMGERETTHPVRGGGFLTSVRAQAGNADDAVLRRKFGAHWRSLAGEGRGRLRAHVAATAAAVVAAALAVRPRSRPLAALAAGTWSALTAEFAIRRVLAGPRTASEIARMAVTSVLIPPIAVSHRLRGELAARRAGPPRGAVLFDRDDTLIEDGPYLADPDRVRPLPGAAGALDTVRSAGVRVGVVTNQSGVARGLITADQLAAVNARVESLLGPFDTWQVCAHGEQDDCACRKPKPGMVRRAARALGVPPSDCVVIGDTGADVDAALAAGAWPILVPTDRTEPGEIEHARRRALVAADITEAAGLALDVLDRAVAR